LTTPAHQPAPPSATRQNRAGPQSRTARWLVALLAFLILTGLLSSIGGPHSFIEGLSAVLPRALAALSMPLASILAGLAVFRFLASRSTSTGTLPDDSAAPLFALSCALGAGLVMLVTVTLALLAGLRADTPLWLGLALAALAALSVKRLPEPLRTAPLAAARLSPWLLLCLPALAIGIVAAASPPGWLWNSEFGGFDALSYHLQLPREWERSGTPLPVEHNVYSYLPGYVETMFASWFGDPGVVPTNLTGPLPPPSGILAHAALTQEFHLGFALLTAFILFWTIRAATSFSSSPSPVASSPLASFSPSLAAALFLATPWIIVTGSLAYNDLPVTLFFAAALLAALAHKPPFLLPPSIRGLTSGALVGLACSCKPTALLFVAPPVALLLLGLSRPRDWWKLALPGALAGTAVMLPWLLRNYSSCSNPVFPYLTSLFGPAHWSPEQLARYTSAHHFDGTLFGRLRLLVLPDPTDPAGARHRGLLHPQWAIFFPVVAISAAIAATWKPASKLALLLIAGLLLQLAAWLFATHLQSRFLIPLAVPGSLLFGLAVARLLGTPTLRVGSGTPTHRVGPSSGTPTLRVGSSHPSPSTLARAHARRALLILPIAVQSTVLLVIFSNQHDLDPSAPLGNPNFLLVHGTSVMTGEAFRAEYDAAPPATRAEMERDFAPAQFVNLCVPRGAKLYLLGDAAPFFFERPVLYSTTWDTSLIAPAIAAHPADPARWADPLRDAGISYILFNGSELTRYSKSGANPAHAGTTGWLDPRLAPVDKLAAWLDSHATLIHDWPLQGAALFRLDAAETPR
jgi:hypothetical protein